jgi:hypothetical protein
MHCSLQKKYALSFLYVPCTGGQNKSCCIFKWLGTSVSVQDFFFLVEVCVSQGYFHKLMNDTH